MTEVGEEQRAQDKEETSEDGDDTPAGAVIWVRRMKRSKAELFDPSPCVASGFSA